MDLLLVNPDDRNLEGNMPWGVLSLGSYLRQVGRRVRVLDVTTFGEKRFFEELPSFAREFPLIGVSVMSRYAPFLTRVADMVKQANPACRVIVGGAHAILNPEQTAAYKNIDFVAYGEGEIALDKLIEAIAAGQTDFANVPGVVYKNASGEICRTPTPAPAPFYDIDYSLLHPSVTATFPNYIQVLAGRGCSYKCTFCFNAVRGEKWRPRPAVELVAEIEKIVARYNPKVIYFRDENFFQSKQRVREFLRLYREKGFSFYWRANCRLDYLNDGYINPEFLQELASARCQAMKFGVESGSERIQIAIRKRLRLSKIKKAITWLSAAPSIRKYYSFLIGMPGEDLDDYKATMKLVGWILRTDPRSKLVGPQYFRVYPGGELYEEIRDKWGYQGPRSLEEWREIYLDPDNDDGWDKGVEYPWIPDNGRRLAKQASLIVDDYRRIYSSDSVVTWSPVKRAFLKLIKLSLDARFELGLFGGMYEYKLIKVASKAFAFIKRPHLPKAASSAPSK